MTTVDDELAQPVPYAHLKERAVAAGVARRQGRRRARLLVAVAVAVVIVVLVALGETVVLAAPAVAIAAAVWALPHFVGRAPAWRVATVLAPLAVAALVIAPRLGDDASRMVVVGPAAPSTYRAADDFSDPRSGWDENDDAKGSNRYAGGQYEVSIGQPNRGTFASRRWSALPANLRLEVDATKSSAALGSFGLACRDNGGPRYEGRIDVNGVWRITKAGKDVNTGTSEAIFPDKANRIAIECTDQQRGAFVVTLFVNGVFLGQISDADPLPPGGVGVVLASNTEPVSVLFDNFTITGL